MILARQHTRTQAAAPPPLQRLSRKEIAFSQKIAETPNVQKIELQNLALLKTILQRGTFEDPYAASPAYYGLTGRRGLWVYARENTVILFCLHPNVQNKVLVFPPFGAKPEKELNRFLELVSPLDMKLHLSRFSAGYTAPPDKAFREQKEKTLDWKYPVHTISCHDLMQRKGKAYQVIRQSMNKFSRRNTQIRTIDFQQDACLLRTMAEKWEHSRQTYYNDYEVPCDYFSHLIELCQHAGLELTGTILYLDGEPMGFCIWEMPVPGRNCANIFASQIKNDEHTNLCTYLVVKSCEKMRNSDIDNACLGGSETEGLDRYKRKFIPHSSLQLKTFVPEKQKIRKAA